MKICLLTLQPVEFLDLSLKEDCVETIIGCGLFLWQLQHSSISPFIILRGFFRDNIVQFIIVKSSVPSVWF